MKNLRLLQIAFVLLIAAIILTLFVIPALADLSGPGAKPVAISSYVTGGDIEANDTYGAVVYDDEQITRLLYTERFNQTLMTEIAKQYGRPRAEQDFTKLDQIARANLVPISSALLRPPSKEDIEAANAHLTEAKIQNLLDRLTPRNGQTSSEVQQLAAPGDTIRIPEIQDIADTLLGHGGSQITVRQFSDGRLAVSFQQFRTQEDGTNWTQGVLWQTANGTWRVHFVDRPPGQNIVFDPSVEIREINGQEQLILTHNAANQVSTQVDVQTLPLQYIPDDREVVNGQIIVTALQNSTTNAIHLDRQTGVIVDSYPIQTTQPGDLLDYNRSKTDDQSNTSATWLQVSNLKIRRAVFDEVQNRLVLQPEAINASQAAQFYNGVEYANPENGNPLYIGTDYNLDRGLLIEVDKNTGKVVKVTPLLNVPNTERLETQANVDKLKQQGVTYRLTSIVRGAVKLSPDGSQIDKIAGIVDIYDAPNNSVASKWIVKDKNGQQLASGQLADLLDPEVLFMEDGELFIIAHDLDGNPKIRIIEPDAQAGWPQYTVHHKDVADFPGHWLGHSYKGEQNDLIKIGPNTFVYFAPIYRPTSQDMAGQWPTKVEWNTFVVKDVIYFPIIMNNAQ